MQNVRIRVRQRKRFRKRSLKLFQKTNKHPETGSAESRHSRDPAQRLLRCFRGVDEIDVDRLFADVGGHV